MTTPLIQRNEEGDHHKGNLTSTLLQSNLTSYNTDDLLGSVFWFTLRKGCSLSQLHQAATLHGLDKDFLPDGPTPGASFRYALNRAHVGQEGIKTELLTTNPTEQKAKLVGAILQRQKDDTVNRVDYFQVCRVALLLRDRAGAELPSPVFVREVKENPIALRVESLYDWHRNHLTPDELRPVCTNVVHHLRSLTLRQSGGIYFVPGEGQETLEVLCRVLADVGSTGFVLPIFRSDAAESTLFQVAEDDLIDEVGQVLQELDSFEESLDNDKTVKESTLDRRGDRLQELRDKALLYARVLRKDATDLEAKLQQAESRLLDIATKREEKSSQSG